MQNFFACLAVVSFISKVLVVSTHKGEQNTEWNESEKPPLPPPVESDRHHCESFWAHDTCMIHASKHGMRPFLPLEISRVSWWSKTLWFLLFGGCALFLRPNNKRNLLGTIFCQFDPWKQAQEKKTRYQRPPPEKEGVFFCSRIEPKPYIVQRIEHSTAKQMLSIKHRPPVDTGKRDWKSGIPGAEGNHIPKIKRRKHKKWHATSQTTPPFFLPLTIPTKPIAIGIKTSTIMSWSTSASSSVAKFESSLAIFWRNRTAE